MKLPAVPDAKSYRGLYVFDFGEWSAVGYTADEIAMLLESEAYRAGKVYKIVRATPDGQMELRGVAPERFELESGLFFSRDEASAAEADLDTLVRLAEKTGAPCRAFAHLADYGPSPQPGRYVTALIYPAEYEDEIAAWLDEVHLAGGEIGSGAGVAAAGAATIASEAQSLALNLQRDTKDLDDVIHTFLRAVQAA